MGLHSKAALFPRGPLACAEVHHGGGKGQKKPIGNMTMYARPTNGAVAILPANEDMPESTRLLDIAQVVFAGVDHCPERFRLQNFPKPGTRQWRKWTRSDSLYRVIKSTSVYMVLPPHILFFFYGCVH
jgi:hypothetical protein